MACPRCHEERSCGTCAITTTYHARSEVIGESEYLNCNRHAPRPGAEMAFWSVVRQYTGPSILHCSRGIKPLSQSNHELPR